MDRHSNNYSNNDNDDGGDYDARNLSETEGADQYNQTKLMDV